MDSGTTSKRVKRSVAILIRRDDMLLTLKRPDDDDELPGVWGLPAGTYHGEETRQDLVDRIGRRKLGVRIECGEVLVRGRQERAGYILEMELIEGRLAEDPGIGEWRWVWRHKKNPPFPEGLFSSFASYDCFSQPGTVGGKVSF
jgi:hypothetical protein